MGKIKYTIITPERIFKEGEADFVVLEAHDGGRGFLFNHCPMFLDLGIGEVKFRNGDSTEYMVVEGGILEIIDNRMIILAETVVYKSELNKDEIQNQLNEICEKNMCERIELSVESKKLKARLKLVSR